MHVKDRLPELKQVIYSLVWRYVIYDIWLCSYVIKVLLLQILRGDTENESVQIEVQADSNEKMQAILKEVNI